MPNNNSLRRKCAYIIKRAIINECIFDSKFMKVTIITVCLNSASTIEKTIQSVLNQSYADIEYIIIDGKSTDGTLDIINKYKNKFAGRMTVYSEKDGGIYHAMNKGIKRSHGDIIGIINSDDWYEQSAVEDSVTAILESGKRNVITYGFMRFYDNENEESILFNRHEFLNRKMITHPTCFVSKSVYKKIGLFDTKYKLAADYDFIVRAYKGGIEFIPIYKLISNFKLGGASSSVKLTQEVIKIKRKNSYNTKAEYLKEMFFYRITETIEIVRHTFNKRKNVEN